MAALISLSQNISDPFRDGSHIVTSLVRHDGGTNTVSLPAGALANNNQVVAIPCDADDTAPTATLAQTAPAAEGDRQSTTVTLTGGSSGDFFVITRHVGIGAHL
jgi:hypothetical protein